MENPKTPRCIFIQTFDQYCMEMSDVFVVLCLQIPGYKFSGTSLRGGAKGHNMSSCTVDRNLGNRVLAAPQYGSQVEEGDRAEEFNVNYLTAPLVRLSDR